MMCFSCEACARPCTTAEVHAWSLDRPACSAACVEALPRRDAGDPREALDRAIALLAGGVHQIDHAWNLHGQHLTRRNAAVAANIASLVVGGPLALAAGTALVDGAERTYGGLEDVLWALDQHLVLVARQLMLLHSLGYAIAGPMRPLVLDVDTLVTPSGVASKAELLVLRNLLIHLHGGVSSWRHALG